MPIIQQHAGRFRLMLCALAVALLGIVASPVSLGAAQSPFPDQFMRDVNMGSAAPDDGASVYVVEGVYVARGSL